MTLKIKNTLKKYKTINRIVALTRWIRQAVPCAFPILLWRIRFPGGAFLVMTPDHANLGDHAIAKSEIQLLNDIKMKYCEITTNRLQEMDNLHLLHLLNGRLILVCGGGNLGTLWFSIEVLFRKVIEENPKSTIFCLPNTIYYEDSVWGNKELDNSIRIYNGHKHLRLYAREKISYDYMKEFYKDVCLVPDMVLALNESNPVSRRSGCILCLRQDIEKEITDEQVKHIEQMASGVFGNAIQYIDTVNDTIFNISDRNIELDKKLSQFRQAELVITDRLHGMIFSAITGTPCIVIDSKSPKLKGCYEWIKHLKYIRFCDDIGEILSIYNEMPKDICIYDNECLSVYYKQLKDDILNWRSY